MKKPLSLLLVLTMICALFTFTACGSETPAATDTPAPETATPAPATDTPDDGEEEPDEPAGPVYDELKLKTATSDTETSGNGLDLQWFIDYLYEKSGGKIVLECYFGGSFCSAGEVADYVTSGDLDMSFMQPIYYVSTFPLAFSLAGYESMEQVMNALYAGLDDPEIHDIIQAQGAENNFYLLGYGAAGPSLLFGTKEITSWEQIAADGLKLGSPINLDVYAALGAATTAVEPPDMYDSMSRGVMDIAAFSATGILNSKLHEVGKNVGDMRAYFAGSNVTINLDVWNSMSADTQALFNEAVRAFSDHTIEITDEIYAQLKSEVLDMGGTWNMFTDQEGMDFNILAMNGTVAMLKGYCQNLGCLDEFETLVNFWNKQLGQDYTF